MTAALKFDDIFDIPVLDDTITLDTKGGKKTLQIFPLTPRKMAMVVKRFPDVKELQDLQSPDAVDENGMVALDNIDVIYAMAAAALGKINDTAFEERLDQVFTIDQLSEIISKAQGISMPTGDNEDFSERSA